MRLIKYDSKQSFADCKAILLMSRWRAIPSSKYISIDASIISIYSLSVALLVETCKKKGHSQISLKMSYTYQYLCCIPAAYVLHSM